MELKNLLDNYLHFADEERKGLAQRKGDRAMCELACLIHEQVGFHNIPFSP